MEIQNIKVADIVPNDYNPNEVNERNMESLIKSVDTDGIKAPVIIRRPDKTIESEKGIKDKYIIVDGEHRWKSAKELELEEVPCEVHEKMTRAEAMIMTIQLNKFRGEFDSIKLAEVLKALKETFPPEELEDKLGYSTEELQSYGELLDFDPSKFETPPEDISKAIAAEDEAIMLNEFAVSVNLRQLEIIEAAVETANKDGDKPVGLTLICEEYLKKTAPEKVTEIDERQKELEEAVPE